MMSRNVRQVRGAFKQNCADVRATSTPSLWAVFFLGLIFIPITLCAQVNGVGQRPDLGWGSWTQQVIYGGPWATEAQIKAQSDALKSTGLQQHGYIFINIDSGWQSGFDGYGRPMVNLTRYPSGLAALAQYIHNNGQKAGIYWIPGMQYPAYSSGGSIYGTSYPLASIVDTTRPGNAFSISQPCCNYWHMKIDFTKPGAQEYVNSVVNMFASWGFDAIKLDGVTPGSDVNDLTVDNRAEVQAWSKAIAQSGRPMGLTVSWNLDHDYLSTWQTWANARRIEDDVNCYCSTATEWKDITRLFADLKIWQKDAGPTQGWNDLDSLIVGNGNQDGLTQDERQSTMTLWAIANSPMIIGDDLTKLDSFGLQLLTNDNVIAVDQSGVPGLEVTSGNNPVWASPVLPNGTYNVALFNLNSSASTTTINFSSLGFTGAADVYDLWAGRDLGNFTDSYTATLNSHASALVRITPATAQQVPQAPSSLRADASSGQVNLSWSASSGATSYNVYRATVSGAETKIASGVQVTSYVDTTVTNQTQYFYQVTAVNSAGESPKSVEVSATPQAIAPAAPTGLAATPGNAKVTLTWTASAGATGYNIYRGTSSGAETRIGNGITATMFTDATVTNGTTYYYQVTAANTAGESPQSNEVSSTPTAGFSLATSSTSLTLSSKQSGSATSTISITPNSDTRTLIFSCSNLPLSYTCVFTPSSLDLTGKTTAQNVTLSVSSSTHVASLLPSGMGPARAHGRLMALLIPSCFFGFVLLPGRLMRWKTMLVAVVALAAAFTMTGCGGGGNPSSSATNPTPTTYNFQVNVQANGATVQSVNYTLTVQ